ncbi:CAF17-like 4Fe-4S cluster assembly/insertion protein YgfZ [Corynebacterium macginleyi]|uniref:CAF17-like 4Fe-4S cluster assembly/insertion protein YgfZ n=1 Tax=Corynebacterium macginleyi TaxID=38290 RepID=UPI00190D875A|nr:folate-binding protein YgfZ [Corynebacterium macginleyi]MBK4178750.1 folate-binding protein [Corynebacterium macginleyi]
MSYSSPLLQRAGAAEHQDATVLDAQGVAWHYGNPLGEQRAAETGTIAIDRSQRRVLRVSGADAPGFLNNLLSQKLDDVPSGFSAGALDLDTQGHIVHHMDITRVGDNFYLDLPAAQFESARDFFTKMVFWSAVTIEEADIAIITMLGKSNIPIPPTVTFSREVQWLGTKRVDLGIPRAKLVETMAMLETEGAQLAGLMAFTAERVRAREPELAADLDKKSIPHEVPQWISRSETNPAHVHLNKGCYRGQETVAPVENLGRSPRLLVLLHLDGSAPERPTVGDDITFNGRKVGRIGTVVDDCDFGPIALGLVKRSGLDAGTVEIGDTAASIDPSSIPEDEGPKAGRAAVNRLRGR